MALWTYAFVTAAEFKDRCALQGDERDALIEDVISEASRRVESAYGHDVMARTSRTEEGPVDPLRIIGPELYLNENPIVSVTSVKEDTTRAFATALVEGTDFLVVKPVGKLVRISSSLRKDWLNGWRCIQVVYVAGHKRVTDSQPAAAPNLVDTDTGRLILNVFWEYARWLWKWRTEGSIGLSAISDATGNRTFIGPPMITAGMMAELRAAGAKSSLEVPVMERDA